MIASRAVARFTVELGSEQLGRALVAVDHPHDCFGRPYGLCLLTVVEDPPQPRLPGAGRFATSYRSPSVRLIVSSCIAMVAPYAVELPRTTSKRTPHRGCAGSLAQERGDREHRDPRRPGR